MSDLSLMLLPSAKHGGKRERRYGGDARSMEKRHPVALRALARTSELPSLKAKYVLIYEARITHT